jgi:effector-binding domain-containing protein/dienelactone hydrolase
MAYSITKKEIAAQPVIVVRRRIKPSDVAATLAEGLGQVFAHAQQYGIALAGQPFTRYLEWGPGLWTIEAGMPVTAHSCETPGGVDVYPGALPGGWVATTTHTGAYDKLNEAHAALQQWIESEGLAAAGAAWEVYTTDPADYPNPKDWKTEIFWPVRERAKRERSEIGRKPVVYKLPGMEGVIVRRDIEYQIAETGPLTMNLYRPPNATSATRLPAVIFVFGYSDLGAEQVFGCKLQEMESYISWAKLVAATGLIGVTYVNHDPMRDLEALLAYIRQNAAALGIDEQRIGFWSCSGNVPRALGALLEGAHPEVRCAALCYGCMLDLDGATDVAEGAHTWHFVNPTAGKTVRDLRADVPLFIARAGRDTREMNRGIDRFAAHALAANLPVTVANHPTGPHAFDVLDDSETSRQIIRQILAFLRIHLLA